MPITGILAGACVFHLYCSELSQQAANACGSVLLLGAAFALSTQTGHVEVPFDRLMSSVNPRLGIDLTTAPVSPNCSLQ